MISKRLLEKYRRDALRGISPELEVVLRELVEHKERILKLTQILLDQHLINGEK